MAKLTIILITYNAINTIFESCLKSLNRLNMLDSETIVVDNGSDDRTVDYIREKLKPDKLILNKQNLGVASAFNIGAAASTTEFLIFLTQDVVPYPNCLKHIIETLEKGRNIGAVGCKLLYPDRKTIQHAGAYLDFPRAMGIHIGYKEIDNGQYDKERCVEYVTGALFGIRAEVLKKIGGFDEKYFPAYYEDSDLCFRLNKLGYSNLYQPKAVALHGENYSTKDKSIIRLNIFHINRLRFVFKHYNNELLKEFMKEEIAAILRADSNERILLINAFDWYYDTDNLYDFALPSFVKKSLNRIRL